MISHLSPTDFSSLEESSPAVQVVLGSLKILNDSNIHHQSIFLNSFSSETEISNCTISDISLVDTNIEVVSSQFNISDVKIDGIQLIEGGIQQLKMCLFFKSS